MTLEQPITHSIAIAVNAIAGSGRSLETLAEIEKELKGRNISYQVFQTPWPAEFAGFTAVWIVGGDGTLNHFINYYSTIQLPLAFFKGGSGNDFHYVLYGDKSTNGIIELALAASPRKIDAGKCNGCYFINGLGIGFDGSVAKSLQGKNKLLGKASFLTVILSKIFFYRAKKYRIESDVIKMERKLLMINIMNGRRLGGGFYVTPPALFSDGKFDINIVIELHALRRLRFLPVIEKGRHIDLSFIKYFHSTKIKIESDQPMDIHLDGEYINPTQVEIEMIPGKFLFYC
jgi:diacylglycerol kinase (ATP)